MKGLLVDSSVYHPNARPYRKQYGDKTIWRIPYTWADDAWMLGDVGADNPIQIMCFHPIHIFLNSLTMARYNIFKRHAKSDNISGIEKWGWNGNMSEFGVGSILLEILTRQRKDIFKFLTEVPDG
jgi:hypothetical protein